MTVTLATLFLCVAVALALGMGLVWLVVLRGASSGWVDAFWSFLVGAAGVAVALVPLQDWEGAGTRHYLIALAAALWALRLGSHIVARTLCGAEDPRYAELKKQWGAAWRGRLFVFLQIQAAVALLLSTTIFLAARNPESSLQWSDFAGLALLIIAVAGEGLADSQLARFGRDPANQHKVCDTGLWGLSRHPNYFFQWLGWTGYAVIAIGPASGWSWGWAALVGPAFMYWLLVHVSGIPPLEQHMMRSRGPAYGDYRRRVSAFWLLPETRS